jgi:hypothetical protein
MALVAGFVAAAAAAGAARADVITVVSGSASAIPAAPAEGCTLLGANGREMRLDCVVPAASARNLDAAPVRLVLETRAARACRTNDTVVPLAAASVHAQKLPVVVQAEPRACTP